MLTSARLPGDYPGRETNPLPFPPFPVSMPCESPLDPSSQPSDGHQSAPPRPSGEKTGTVKKKNKQRYWYPSKIKRCDSLPMSKKRYPADEAQYKQPNNAFPFCVRSQKKPVSIHRRSQCFPCAYGSLFASHAPMERGRQFFSVRIYRNPLPSPFLCIPCRREPEKSRHAGRLLVFGGIETHVGRRLPTPEKHASVMRITTLACDPRTPTVSPKTRVSHARPQL